LFFSAFSTPCAAAAQQYRIQPPRPVAVMTSNLLVVVSDRRLARGASNGDVVVMDEDCRITIVDRSKDVILTGGESVPSVEVETVYAHHPGIVDCAAVGVEDKRWGEAILLVAVLKDPDAPEPDLAVDLCRFGHDRLAGFKVPKRVAFIDALPRSHFGKVLKRDLREFRFETVFDPWRGAIT